MDTRIFGSIGRIYNTDIGIRTTELEEARCGIQMSKSLQKERYQLLACKILKTVNRWLKLLVNSILQLTDDIRRVRLQKETNECDGFTQTLHTEAHRPVRTKTPFKHTVQHTPHIICCGSFFTAMGQRKMSSSYVSDTKDNLLLVVSV